MKSLARNLSALTILFTSGHGAADVIYSGLQNITIPATYAGTYIDVDGMTFSTSPITTPGWDLNPFMGGVYLYNNAAFQPARDGTGGMDTVLDFAAGTTIGSGLNFATGSGGSMDHLGTSSAPPPLFPATHEGYLGFKLGSNYGWMRVVFTNNAAGAKVLDWAYDTSGSGGAIATGNVTSDGSTVTLDSTFGSFTLGSAITGGNSVVKTGAATTTLTGTNTYTGTTTIKQGTLALAATGSIANSTTLVVGDAGSSGAVLDVTAKSGYTIASGTTLKGSGTVNVGSGNTLAISGTHAPGNSPGIQSVTGNLSYGTGSIFEWDLASSATGERGTQYDGVTVTGTLGGSGAIFKVVLDSGSYAEGFWKTNQQWTGIFTASNTVNMADIFSDIQWSGGSLLTTPLTTPPGHFSFTNSGTTLTWTAVPEPSTALAGLLLGAGLLRRRR